MLICDRSAIWRKAPEYSEYLPIVASWLLLRNKNMATVSKGGERHRILRCDWLAPSTVAKNGKTLLFLVTRSLLTVAKITWQVIADTVYEFDPNARHELGKLSECGRSKLFDMQNIQLLRVLKVKSVSCLSYGII